MNVCAACGYALAVKRTGVQAELMAPGTGEYQLYAADLLECPGCAAKILVTANTPMAQQRDVHYGTLRHRPVQFWMSRREREKHVSPQGA